MINPKLLLSMVFALASCATQADGSVPFDPDIRELLGQRAFFANALYETYDFATQATGERIGNETNRALGGTRIGPYRIAARLRNSTGNFDRTLVINCATAFLDRHGKETENARQATAIREEFLSIEIERLDK